MNPVLSSAFCVPPNAKTFCEKGPGQSYPHSSAFQALRGGAGSKFPAA